MRKKLIAALFLYNSLPPQMRHKIIKELEECDAADIINHWFELINKYVGIFTSNA